MKIREAKDVFDKVDYEADEDWQISPQTLYQCSVCGETIAFSLTDLDKHAFSKFTNLSAEDSAQIEILINESKVQGFNSFIDFYCPKCKKAIRVYYQSWAGGRYTNGHKLLFLVD